MTLRYIILGLIMNKPMTGYDLKTFFKNSVNFFWSAELSQIYRELSKLERQGYLRSTTRQQEGRPNKKLYMVTEQGTAAFMEWLTAFPDNLVPISRNEFLVRIFFSSRLPEKQLIDQLKRYIHQQELNFKTYRTIDERLSSCIPKEKSTEEAFYQRLTVRRGMYFAQSEISWAKECLEDIDKRMSEGW